MAKQTKWAVEYFENFDGFDRHCSVTIKTPKSFEKAWNKFVSELAEDGIHATLISYTKVQGSKHG